MDKIMMQMMSQAMYCLLRGFLSCFPQERVEKVLILASAILGQQIGMLYAGDELSVYKLRKACRDAFEQATKEAPVIPHAADGAATATIDATQRG